MNELTNKLLDIVKELQKMTLETQKLFIEREIELRKSYSVTEYLIRESELNYIQGKIISLFERYLVEDKKCSNQ